MLVCIVCNKPLSGRQEMFCGRACKNKSTNHHHQSYARQQARGRERKVRLITMLGGQCRFCGYSRNLAALEFHHRTPGTKSFQLDARALANRNWQEIMEEAKKCDLLCSNCHAEAHHPGASALPGLR